MFVITATNVRDALPKAVQYLLAQGRTEYTRLGKAFVAPGPVTIHYLYPKQHVLLNPVRDANPFFHLMEAIWMLAGRDDGKFLDPYIKDFSKTYGNEDGTIMDAYGYRWRYGLEDIDQLDEIVTQMRKDASTRQAVLQMWGAGRCDLVVNSAKPCNLVAVFRILNGRLNMTVFNRSNDVIWGCCGANAVHFPILQEYLAGKIGVGLGEYWQVTTNLHLYEHHINMLGSRISNEDLLSEQLSDNTPYGKTQPLIDDEANIDDDIKETIDCIEIIQSGSDGYNGTIVNSFLRDTVVPMALAHQRFKDKYLQGAYDALGMVKADDWQEAGIAWIVRRSK